MNAHIDAYAEKRFFSTNLMSGVDVKSLFKSGKKSIKAFKIAAGPVSTTEKAAEESIESWETSQATTVVPVVNVALEEFKQEQQEEGTKTAVSWSQMYVNNINRLVLFPVERNPLNLRLLRQRNQPVPMFHRLSVEQRQPLLCHLYRSFLERARPPRVLRELRLEPHRLHHLV